MIYNNKQVKKRGIIKQDANIYNKLNNSEKYS